MATEAHCEWCGKVQTIIPSRVSKYRFCSINCRNKWRQKYWSGDKNPKWLPGTREKACEGCGVLFQKPRRQAMCVFKTRKFCSKACADKHGFRYEGESHPNWKAETRRKNRRGKHGSWARAVISRDSGKCQHCGMTENLHAHHIKEFAEYPELRWDIANGLTLCFWCHQAVHAAANANGVNSGKLPPAQPGAEDNPEPSFGRKPVEGVTTSGRVYRRWNGNCEWCGAFISRRWSDVKGKKHVFCSKECSGSFGAKHDPDKFQRKRQ